MDEATFTCDGVFNKHNNHVWPEVNPHSTRLRGGQQRFSVNMWTRMIHGHLIEPNFFTRLPRWPKVPHLSPAGVELLYQQMFKESCNSSPTEHQLIFPRMSKLPGYCLSERIEWPRGASLLTSQISQFVLLIFFFFWRQLNVFCVRDAHSVIEGPRRLN